MAQHRKSSILTKAHGLLWLVRHSQFDYWKLRRQDLIHTDTPISIRSAIVGTVQSWCTHEHTHTYTARTCLWATLMSVSKLMARSDGGVIKRCSIDFVRWFVGVSHLTSGSAFGHFKIIILLVSSLVESCKSNLHHRDNCPREQPICPRPTFSFPLANRFQHSHKLSLSLSLSPQKPPCHTSALCA